MRMIRIISIVLLFGFSVVSADFSKYSEFVEEQSKNETFKLLFQQHLDKFQDRSRNLRSGATFTCKPYPQPEGSTTSVHKLRPMDVKVIGALGDSITAGTGITAATVLGLLAENRGLSWSVGGKGDVSSEQTLPNFIKLFRPDVTGYSTGTGPVEWESVAHLNVANPGDTSDDMPGQAELIVKRMKADKNINFDEDWKVITLFIGGNDLCDFCEDKQAHGAENYISNIQNALDYLHENVPRAFVNVVEILKISMVKELNQNLVCDALHLFLCRCAAYPANSEAEAEMQAETVRYRNMLNQLVESGRYDTKDDFTVVVQPFFRDTHPPQKSNSDEPDLSYFAPDCFHLSLKGHRAAADALWNNMVEPVGQKRTMWTPEEAVECPSVEAPYFYTYKNSGLSKETFGPSDARLPESGLRSLNRKPGNDSQGGANHTGVIVVGVLSGVLLCVLIGAFVLKRRVNRRKLDSEILLRPSGRQYQAI